MGQILTGFLCSLRSTQSKCPAVMNYSKFRPALKISQLSSCSAENNLKQLEVICVIRSLHSVDIQDDFNILLKHSHMEELYSNFLFVNSQGRNIVFGICFEGMSIICLLFYIRIST